MDKSNAMRKFLSYLFAVLLLFGAVAHIIMPEAYEPMIPEFIPSLLANILAAIAEAVVGVALIIPRYRTMGGLLFALLMLAFLPIHIWDLFREDPAIGEQPIPTIRVIIQFLLIYAGWWIYRKGKSQ